MLGISPGLYVDEMPFAQYTAALAGTVVCMVGGASKGPVGVPTMTTSEGSFIEKFGPPLVTDSGAQAAIQFLRAGNRLLYVRVAHAAATATRSLAGTTGGTAAVRATGTITFGSSTNPLDGETVTISDGVNSKAFEFDSNGTVTGGNVGVLIGTNAAATAVNLLTAINNSVVNVVATDATVTVPVLSLRNKTGGTAGNVTITDTVVSANFVTTGMSTGAAAVAGTSATVVTFSAASPGSWGNALSVRVISPSADTTAPSGNFDLHVLGPPPGTAANATPTVVERFVNVSLTPTDDRFVETVLSEGVSEQSAASRYVRAEALTTGKPTSGTFALGAGGGTVGTDGVSGLVASDYVGTVSGQTATGLMAVASAEQVEFNILAIPGVSNATVIQAGLTTCENRGDCFYLIDPPIGLDPETVVSWSNGGQPAGVPNAPATAIDSAGGFGMILAQWRQVTDPYNRQKVWIPPSAFVAAGMALADTADGPWQPAAGLDRAVPGGVLEYNTTQAQRDYMTGDNKVNPFVKFPGNAPALWGNKTCQRRPGVTQGVHARRMFIFVQKAIATASRYLVWQPNDSITQQKFEMLCNQPLATVAGRRGLKNFSVVCNASTNPPEQTAQGIMRGQVIVQPYDITERIVMGFAATQTDTTFDPIVSVATDAG